MRTYAAILALASGAAATAVWATPHDKYSSSVGVLGCKINTDRVAYWPGSVDCNNICVKLSYGGRSVHLLRIDQSGGAYDISYDAWNYLQTGKSAAVDPTTGGGVAMDYEEVDASECADLLYTPGSKLPLSAPNSIDFVASCLAQPDSWVAKNYVLYNICDAICSLGYDEPCTLNLAVSNQPSCPHTLGLQTSLTTAPVYDIEYMSGKTVLASTGQVVAHIAGAEETADGDTSSGSNSNSQAQSSPAVASPQPAAVPSPATSSPVAPPAKQATTSSSSALAASPTLAVFVEVSASTSSASQTTTLQSSTTSIVMPTTLSSVTASAASSTADSTTSASQTRSTTMSLPSASRTASSTPSPSISTVQTGGAVPARADVASLALVLAAVMCLMGVI